MGAYGKGCGALRAHRFILPPHFAGRVDTRAAVSPLPNTRFVQRLPRAAAEVSPEPTLPSGGGQDELGAPSWRLWGLLHCYPSGRGSTYRGGDRRTRGVDGRGPCFRAVATTIPDKQTQSPCPCSAYRWFQENEVMPTYQSGR